MVDSGEVNRHLEEVYTADNLAKLVVDHITNDKGEVLARVWENQGFQEIYDYKGNNKARLRLKRKQEQVFNQIDASKQLFQKVYYHPELI